jgi:hypothetical protein
VSPTKSSVTQWCAQRFSLVLAKRFPGGAPSTLQCWPEFHPAHRLVHLQCDPSASPSSPAHCPLVVPSLSRYRTQCHLALAPAVAPVHLPVQFLQFLVFLARAGLRCLPVLCLCVTQWCASASPVLALALFLVKGISSAVPASWPEFHSQRTAYASPSVIISASPSSSPSSLPTVVPSSSPSIGPSAHRGPQRWPQCSSAVPGAVQCFAQCRTECVPSKAA